MDRVVVEDFDPRSVEYEYDEPLFMVVTWYAPLGSDDANYSLERVIRGMDIREALTWLDTAPIPEYPSESEYVPKRRELHVLAPSPYTGRPPREGLTYVGIKLVESGI